MKRKPKARRKAKTLKVVVPKNAKERFEKASYDDLCTFTTGKKVEAALKWAKKIVTPIHPKK
jgi:hypothetical protein